MPFPSELNANESTQTLLTFYFLKIFILLHLIPPYLAYLEFMATNARRCSGHRPAVDEFDAYLALKICVTLAESRDVLLKRQKKEQIIRITFLITSKKKQLTNKMNFNCTLKKKKDLFFQAAQSHMRVASP